MPQVEKCKEKTNWLNALHIEMKAKFVLLNSGASTGPLHDQRLEDLYKAAAEVHAAIKTICKDDCEVWAHKSDGINLKMGSVGPIKGTRFSYNRSPNFDGWQEDSGLIEKCQLIIIDYFSCHPGL